MIKELFSALKNKYQSLGRREQIMVMVAAFLVTLLLVNGLIIAPLQKKRLSLQAKSKTLHEKLKRIKLLAYKSGRRHAFFLGKDSDIINFVVKQLAKNNIEKRSLKQKTDGQGNLIIKVDAKGTLKELLSFIGLIEGQDFHVGFRRVDLKHEIHNVYALNGEILVQKL